MRLLVIFVNFLFALNVTARVLQKRAVTAPTQKLIADMVKTGSQCTVSANSISAYTASQGYIGALTIHTQDNTLISDILSCSTDCSAILGPMSDEDTVAVISTLDPLTTQFASLLDVIRNKKSVFDSVNLVTPIIKSDLNQFCPHFQTMASCLLSICPSNYAEQMQEYLSVAENACNVVVPLYN